jgi:hypothetical protein
MGRDEENCADQEILLCMNIFFTRKTIYQKNMASFCLHPYASLEISWQHDKYKRLKHLLVLWANVFLSLKALAEDIVISSVGSFMCITFMVIMSLVVHAASYFFYK